MDVYTERDLRGLKKEYQHVLYFRLLSLIKFCSS